MNYEQIVALTMSNLQMLLDNLKIPLAVGPINDDDYTILTSGFTELEWGNGICTYGNKEEKFEFCLKLQTIPLSPIPSGAVLCTYDETAKAVKIHFVESFVRDKKEHPLCGQMFTITLWAVYLFGSAVGECEEVQILDVVNQKVADHYRKYGFSGDLSLLSVPFTKLTGAVNVYGKIAR
ncbi:hypothetical protein [Lonsdalea quercina]|uniref:hypothetical protein n=1 Tax=Lonsdalea quercina TaxID=71657 RepID=UPI003975F137